MSAPAHEIEIKVASGRRITFTPGDYRFERSEGSLRAGWTAAPTGWGGAWQPVRRRGLLGRAIALLGR